MRDVEFNLFDARERMFMKVDKRNIVRLAGAYAAWVMGSGFATGQEILQFFTSFGYWSFLVILVTAVVFYIVGSRILIAGQLHGKEKGFDPFRFLCGNKLGAFYSWFVPVSMFAGMIILISGSGATLQQNFGLNHVVGALLMAVLAYVAYRIGFWRFVKVVSFIGPTIIAFVFIVGGITLFRNNFDITQASLSFESLSAARPVPFWWLAAFLYGAYNLCDGTKYYSRLGLEGASPKEAKLVALLGTVGLMLAILIMNAAMLTDVANVVGVGIPTLYLAQAISPWLSAVFSAILICGIFSSCSAMLWTVCEKFVVQGTKRSYAFAAVVIGVAFLGGLLPFADLIRVVYTAVGFLELAFVVRVLFWRQKDLQPAQGAGEE